MEEKILNVLGRIHRGEEVEDEVLRETVKKLYTRIGFTIHLSSRLSHHSILGVSKEIESLLQRMGEDFDNLTITRYDVPSKSLNLMVVVDPTLGALELRMHESRVKSLYGKAERIENAKVILGEKGKAYKDLPLINSNMNLKLQEIHRKLLEKTDHIEWVRSIEFRKISKREWKDLLKLVEKSYDILRKVDWLMEKGVEILVYDEERYKQRPLSRKEFKDLVDYLYTDSRLIGSHVEGYIRESDELPEGSVGVPYLFPKWLGYSRTEVQLLTPNFDINLGVLEVKPSKELGPHEIALPKKVFENLKLDVKKLKYSEWRVVDNGNDKIDASKLGLS